MAEMRKVAELPPLSGTPQEKDYYRQVLKDIPSLMKLNFAQQSKDFDKEINNFVTHPPDMKVMAVRYLVALSALDGVEKMGPLLAKYGVSADQYTVRLTPYERQMKQKAEEIVYGKGGSPQRQEDVRLLGGNIVVQAINLRIETPRFNWQQSDSQWSQGALETISALTGVRSWQLEMKYWMGRNKHFALEEGKEQHMRGDYYVRVDSISSAGKESEVGYTIYNKKTQEIVTSGTLKQNNNLFFDLASKNGWGAEGKLVSGILFFTEIDSRGRAKMEFDIEEAKILGH